MQLRSGKIIKYCNSIKNASNNINSDININYNNMVLRSGKILNNNNNNNNNNEILKNTYKNLFITYEDNFYDNIIIKKNKNEISTIYTKNKINTNSIFPNNNINLPNDTSIYCIDLKPFESFRIIINDIDYVISFIKFYLEVISNINDKKKYAKTYESKILYKLRIITYINFIYNFIGDNLFIINKYNSKKLVNKFIKNFINKSIIISKDINDFTDYVTKHNFNLSYELNNVIKKIIKNMNIIEELF
jgi:hypothetical protein